MHWIWEGRDQVDGSSHSFVLHSVDAPSQGHCQVVFLVGQDFYSYLIYRAAPFCLAQICQLQYLKEVALLRKIAPVFYYPSFTQGSSCNWSESSSGFKATPWGSRRPTCHSLSCLTQKIERQLEEGFMSSRIAGLLVQCPLNEQPHLLTSFKLMGMAERDGMRWATLWNWWLQLPQSKSKLRFVVNCSFIDLSTRTLFFSLICWVGKRMTSTSSLNRATPGEKVTSLTTSVSWLKTWVSWMTMWKGETQQCSAEFALILF